MFPNFQTDLGRQQEPVYGKDGQVIGAVVFNRFKQCWEACTDGPMVGPFRSRAEADNYVRRTVSSPADQRSLQASRQAAQLPQAPQLNPNDIIGAVVAGAALLGALSSFFGEQTSASSQQSELEKQNELLRQQNELLKQALAGQQPSSGKLVKH